MSCAMVFGLATLGMAIRPALVRHGSVRTSVRARMLADALAEPPKEELLRAGADENP